MLIDGMKLAGNILNNLKFDGKPGLAVVLVGDNPASVIYTSNKIKACEKVGIYSELYELSHDITEPELIGSIKALNKDNKIHGILVQLPLPKQINTLKIIETIDPGKDVDGFHPMNLGRLIADKPHFIACTPLGIVKLIKSTGTNIKGMNATIIGSSIIVGRPLSYLLMNLGATVTVCNEFTSNLSEHTRNADILVSATGVPRLVKRDMVKKGAVVIDVGTSKVDGRLVGDIDFENVKDIAGHITPVPGGVGPMTVACLMENTVKAYNNL